MKWTQVLLKPPKKGLFQSILVFSSVTKTATSYNCQNLIVSVITKKVESNDRIY